MRVQLTSRTGGLGWARPHLDALLVGWMGRGKVERGGNAAKGAFGSCIGRFHADPHSVTRGGMTGRRKGENGTVEGGKAGEVQGARQLA